MDARLRAIEHRVTNVESKLGDIAVDIAVVKTQLSHLASTIPTRWVQILALLAILLPMYGILVTLLWTTLHTTH